jgi:hypothetical protein
VSLGLAVGTLAKGGRDKLTFLPDDEISAFGAWAEQLIAESTGKHGVGIVPVDLEPLGAVESYGTDRAFVRIALAGGSDGGRAALADALEAAGHPVIRIELSDPIDIGAEAFRWEVAIAIAGAVLASTRSTSPNVEEAKQLTRDVLAGGRGAVAGADAAAAESRGRRLTLFGDAALRLTPPRRAGRGAGAPPRRARRRLPCLQRSLRRARTPRLRPYARIRTLWLPRS